MYVALWGVSGRAHFPLKCCSGLCIASKEGRLPTEVIMNPYNQSKRKIMLWFQIWLLRVLRHTCFYSFSPVFLIVGHTNNSLDRFFSRLSVSLRWHNYE